MPHSVSGAILLASPVLRDGVFDDAVIFINAHSKEDGADGCILNRPTGQTVGDFLCSDKFQPLRKLPTYYGGPVGEDKLTFAAYSWNDEGHIQCKPYISAEEALEKMKQSGTLIRATLGYSGWTSGQLEDEIENNAWFLAPPYSQILTMPQDETLWKNTMQELSPFHHIVSLTPENPFLN